MKRQVPKLKRREMAKRFKSLRKKHGLTQMQLAHLIEIHRTEISWIEGAKRYPNHSTITRLEALENRLKHGQELHAASR